MSSENPSVPKTFMQRSRDFRKERWNSGKEWYNKKSLASSRLQKLNSQYAKASQYKSPEYRKTKWDNYYSSSPKLQGYNQRLSDYNKKRSEAWKAAKAYDYSGLRNKQQRSDAWKSIKASSPFFRARSPPAL